MMGSSSWDKGQGVIGFLLKTKKTKNDVTHCSQYNPTVESSLTLNQERKRNFVKIYLFIYLMPWVLVAAHRIFDLSCGMWDPVSWPGIEPRLLAFGVRSLIHWTTREVLRSKRSLIIRKEKEKLPWLIYRQYNCLLRKLREEIKKLEKLKWLTTK